jgi:hypothetical protein
LVIGKKDDDVGWRGGEASDSDKQGKCEWKAACHSIFGNLQFLSGVQQHQSVIHFPLRLALHRES